MLRQSSIEAHRQGDDWMFSEGRELGNESLRAVRSSFETWISYFAEHRGGSSAAGTSQQSQLESLGRCSQRPLRDVEVCERRSGDPATKITGYEALVAV